MIVEARQQMKDLGGGISGFCKALGKHRSLIYRWGARNGRLKDKLPLAKTYPTRISEVKRAEVITEYANSHGLAGGWTLSALVGGISASKAREIIREARPYIVTYMRKLEERLKKNHYEFLNPHTCWSWDYINIWLNMEKMVLQILRDECSRHILNWAITSVATCENVTRLISGAIDKFNIKPLVLKRDNEGALKADMFKAFLALKNIIDLPNPPNYAKYQAHHERGNGDINGMLHLYEINPCTTYSEMRDRVEVTVDYLNNTKPRMKFDGKTSAHVLASVHMASGVTVQELIEEIKKTEVDLLPLFDGKNGLRKLHRYAVTEVLKSRKLLTVEMEPWQDFGKKILYNHKGEALNQLKLFFD